MRHRNWTRKFQRLVLLTAPVLCGFSACTSMDIQAAARAGITSTLNTLFGSVSSAVANGLI